jgi:2,3-diaminopropionate biosynthesis protein SbnA
MEFKKIAEHPTELVNSNCWIVLNHVSEKFKVNLKIEGMSITGSIKIKAGKHMVNTLESSGLIAPGARLIESSSGNLGIALSMICAERGYKFTCVSDPNLSPSSARLIRAYGAELIVVDQRDNNGGYLATRIEMIRSKLASDPGLIWLNQYENLSNVEAHYEFTGREILDRFSTPSYVFVGAGTTGTLGGVSRRIRQYSPNTKIIAVDSLGSVTFGGTPGKRLIPGLGTSTPPQIRVHSSYDELLMVPEHQTLSVCHEFARRGLLLGGSTGTVLAAIRQYESRIEHDACIVAISPDMGDRYLDTIYSEDWCRKNFDQFGLKPSKSSNGNFKNII